MKKILMAFILLAAGAVVAVNLFGAMALGHVLENAIGAPVSVGRLHIGLRSSSVGLYNLKIKNPKGFQEKTLAEIYEISAGYDLAAFFRGQVHLKTVRLNFGDLTIEKKGTQVNLLELGAVKGITQGMGSGNSGAKPQKPGGGDQARAPKGPGLQIDEVLVNIGKTRYVDSSAAPPLVKEYDLGIHEERFKNVTQAPSLVKDIAFLILRKIGLSSLTSNFDILLKGVGGEIQSGFQKLLKA